MSFVFHLRSVQQVSCWWRWLDFTGRTRWKTQQLHFHCNFFLKHMLNMLLWGCALFKLVWHFLLCLVAFTFAYTENTVRKGLASILGPTSFPHPLPPERWKDISLLWCTALGPGLVLVEISHCSISSYVSVQAQLLSSSHVPCFWQGEGERPHEILDLAHGLLVAPIALLHLVKRRKNRYR